MKILICGRIINVWNITTVVQIFANYVLNVGRKKIKKIATCANLEIVIWERIVNVRNMTIVLKIFPNDLLNFCIEKSLFFLFYLVGGVRVRCLWPHPMYILIFAKTMYIQMIKTLANYVLVPIILVRCGQRQARQSYYSFAVVFLRIIILKIYQHFLVSRKLQKNVEFENS